ncbi:hypothetical protein HTSR_0465 [Halodesulfurarchaeum formicicum]|uniref:Uncharacterized protein n=1 Tax=Halodesulfurarchaeum formicicum TaxID=1873524 RepID=A0A1D8S2S1_9EURY|nr:hypothetical protein HTSR_0465 [Halodesulfurarchaeum formicicum]
MLARFWQFGETNPAVPVALFVGGPALGTDHEFLFLVRSFTRRLRSVRGCLPGQPTELEIHQQMEHPDDEEEPDLPVLVEHTSHPIVSNYSDNLTLLAAESVG